MLSALLYTFHRSCCVGDAEPLRGGKKAVRLEMTAAVPRNASLPLSSVPPGASCNPANHAACFGEVSSDRSEGSSCRQHKPSAMPSTLTASDVGSCESMCRVSDESRSRTPSRSGAAHPSPQQGPESPLDYTRPWACSREEEGLRACRQPPFSLDAVGGSMGSKQYHGLL